MPRSKDKPPEKRPVKSLRQRATEALEVAQRKVDRLTKDRDRLTGESLRSIEAELDAATVRRDYVADDPALTADDPAAGEQPAGEVEK